MSKKTGTYRGKVKGATSFVLVSPNQLYDKINKDCKDLMIPIQRKFAESLRLTTAPMNADYKTNSVVHNQVDVEVKNTKATDEAVSSLPTKKEIDW